MNSGLKAFGGLTAFLAVFVGALMLMQAACKPRETEAFYRVTVTAAPLVVPPGWNRAFCSVAVDGDGIRRVIFEPFELCAALRLGDKATVRHTTTKPYGGGDYESWELVAERTP